MAATGRSPRAVTRGESGNQLTVSLDYLNFTFTGGSHDVAVRECMALLGVRETRERSGLHGYERGTDLDGYAVVCSGGDSQRGTVFVSINGQGCGRVADFQSVRSWAESLGARITRLDICADDHDGNAVDVSRAIQAWRDGAFTTQGRPPSASCHDDFGSGHGKTLCVGKRGSGKLCRVYEKGKQLGDSLSKWCRAEVEWHNKDRVIPWDAVTDPVKYLAGAFPFFSFLSLIAERIRTAKKTAEITIEALQKWVRLAAGRSVNALLKHYEGDIGAVIDAVRREGFPRRIRVMWEAEELQAATG